MCRDGVWMDGVCRDGVCRNGMRMDGVCRDGVWVDAQGCVEVSGEVGGGDTAQEEVVQVLVGETNCGVPAYRC